MANIEVDFPRGGTIIADERPTKRKSTKPIETAPQKRTDPEYEDVFTKTITRGMLTEDVRGLGFVKKINKMDIILETTHGIQCTLAALHISDEFSSSLGSTTLDEVFCVGQAVAFKVVKAAKTRSENPIVTTNPTAVNGHLVPTAIRNALVLNGSIISVEDKGALVNVGMGQVRGFVKTADLPPRWQPKELRVGQVLMFRVRKESDRLKSRVLDLSAYADIDVYAEESLNVASLMPGTIIAVEAQKATKSGTFVATEDGTKMFLHNNCLPPRIRLHPERLVKAIRAVVVCTLPNSPLLMISALPDIVAISKPEKRQLPEDYRVGQIVECTVYDIDRLGNLFFVLGTDLDKPPSVSAKLLRAFVEDYEKQIAKFGPGTRHKCRVVGYHAADRQVLLSTRLDAPEPKKRAADDAKRVRERPTVNGAKTDSTKQPQLVRRPAKPFEVCKATVVGAWPFGRTSRFTTAELRFHGGSIGRLHASELPLEDYADGIAPIQQFIDTYKGKTVEVKVICVGARNSVTPKGREMLVKRCGTTRFVDCTMIPSKVAEPHRKLRLINYQALFKRGDDVALFIGDAAQSATGKNERYVRAEISPLFFAHIPRTYVDRLQSTAEKPADDSLTSEGVELVLANGEMQHGLVISQSHTSRSKLVVATIGNTIIKEEPEDEAESGEQRPKRKRRSSEVADINGGGEATSDKSKETNHFATNTQNGHIAKPSDVAEQTPTAKKKKTRDEAAETPAATHAAIVTADTIAALPEDIEREVAATPNSSTAWIKYITHFLRDEKIAEARGIAERALATIDAREEDALFNVWTAYLNAELMFGEEDAWRPIFERAASAMESLRMHRHVAKILAHHGRDEEVDELHEAMIKKFRYEELEVWFAYATRLYETSRADKARELMQRALLSMSKRHHLSIMSRFAQLEYRAGGDLERGKTLFERILQTQPKRADVWNVYADAALKHGNVAEARRILERATAAGMSASRTKALYQKWLVIEKRAGTSKTLAVAKQRMSAFLDVNPSAADDHNDGQE